MALSYEIATSDDVDELCELDSRSFGFRMDAKEIDFIRDNFDLSRFVVVRDSSLEGNPMVGSGGNYTLEVNLPGPCSVPMAGVTWVSVATTHRRRGIAAAMMAWLDDDARAHNEPLIGLTASEGGIYERFGYGIATRSRAITIDRRRVEMAERFKGDTSRIRFVDAGQHLDEIRAVFHRFRRNKVGEVTMPYPVAHHNIESYNPKARMVCALHPDGFAVWQVNPDWNQGDPRHGIYIHMLCGVTPEAHRDLWTLALSTDLGGEIASHKAIAPDDPLPYFLTNPRALKTTHIGDHLWLKVLDAQAAFAARSYRTDDALVVELADGERLRISAEGVSTERRRKRADIVLTESATGPLLVGGVAASTLAAGGRLEALSTRVLDRADAFFGVSPEPHCSVAF